MGSFKGSDEARRNRLASMTDSRTDEAGAPRTEGPAVNPFQGRTQLREACMIRLERISADPSQPRTEFDPEALDRLAASLRQRGQLQPIRVRWDDEGGRYIVVVGERRWRAARIAGMESLACVVVAGNPSPGELLEDQLVENCLREDLKPIEQAKAFRAILDSTGLSQRQLAERLQISHVNIVRSLALLELPESVQASVEQGELAPQTAYEISKLGDVAEQATLAREAVGGKLKRETIRQRVASTRKGGAGGKSRKAASRVFRTTTGRGTIELKKGAGAAEMLVVVEEIAGVLRAELSASDQAAA
jgi:ParB family transcriptional regulator, chromosome partitioning protein